MKLVDILARELEVWPEGLECLSQLKSRGYIINGRGFDGRAFTSAEIADETHIAGAIVTRAQWQAAVDALKAEKEFVPYDFSGPVLDYGPKEWSGEGPPPVGAPVEYQRRGAPNGKWYPTKVNFLSGQHVIFCDSDGDEVRENPSDILFRQIRTPEQIVADERESAIKAFMRIGDIYYCDAEKLYDAGARFLGEGKKA